MDHKKQESRSKVLVLYSHHLNLNLSGYSNTPNSDYHAEGQSVGFNALSCDPGQESSPRPSDLSSSAISYKWSVHQ